MDRFSISGNIVRQYITRPVIFILLFWLCSSAGAYYSPTKIGNYDEKISSRRLIIKLKADERLRLSKVQKEKTVTGLSDFDSLSQKYSINNISKLSADDSNHAALKNILIAEIPENKDMAEIISEYGRLGKVEYVHPDWELQLYESVNDPLFDNQWALNNVGQSYLHIVRGDECYDDSLSTDSGLAGADIQALDYLENEPDNTAVVIVAIIDTGVDMDHPDLVGRIWVNPGEIANNGLDDDLNGYVDDVSGYDFSGDLADLQSSVYPPEGDNDPTDEHGHGTHCAGIIAAVTGNGEGIAGICSKSRIMVLDFYPVMLSSFAAQAIIYAADNGADVISMSWGLPWPVPVIEDALQYARQRGVILCAASGNDGAEQYNYPAAYSQVIAVGASDSDDRVTFFSTYGEHIHIVAPGLSILSLRAANTDLYSENCEPDVHIVNDEYYLASGTSMACPHLAGVAACMRSQSPGLIPSKAEEVILDAADDIIDPYGNGENYPGWDKYSGYGRLNLMKTIDSTPSIRALIDSPFDHQAISGSFDITGIADGNDFTEYILEYGPGFSPNGWTEIIGSSTPVSGGLLGSWNTNGLNGLYSLRLKVGSFNMDYKSIYLLNDTIVTISLPTDNDSIISSTVITGSAICPDFASYRLVYSSFLSPDSFSEISQSTVPVSNNLLADWSVGDLADGWYYLRLEVYSNFGLIDSVYRQVYISSIFSTDNAWKIEFANDISILPNYGDFDNDGENEIIVGTKRGIKAYSIEGNEKDIGLFAGGFDFLTPPAVGDVNGDGVDDLVIVGYVDDIPYPTYFHVYPSGEEHYWFMASRPPRTNNYSGGEEFSFPVLFLKDINGDGRDEIHYYPGQISNSQAQYLIYHPNGTEFLDVPPPPGPEGHFCYLPADLNNDGYDELYTARDILYRLDTLGNTLDSFDLKMNPADWFQTLTMSAIDIDSDNHLELVLFGRFLQPGGTYWTYIFEDSLVLKSGWPQNSDINYYLAMCGPVFGDLDHDGGMEYFLSMSELNYAQILGWHVDGTPYTGDSAVPIFAAPENPAKLTTPVLADLNNDNYPDLIACAEADIYLTHLKERIFAWGRNSDLLSGFPLVTVPSIDTIRTDWHAPVVGDINKDGYIDMIMTTVNNELTFVNFEGVPYNPVATPVPQWRYNRRLNSIGSTSAFVCGDADGSGVVNLIDIYYMINYLYLGGPEPVPPDAGNSDGNIETNILDIAHLITFLFNSGPPPICP